MSSSGITGKSVVCTSEVKKKQRSPAAQIFPQQCRCSFVKDETLETSALLQHVTHLWDSSASRVEPHGDSGCFCKGITHCLISLVKPQPPQHIKRSAGAPVPKLPCKCAARRTAGNVTGAKEPPAAETARRVPLRTDVSIFYDYICALMERCVITDFSGFQCRLVRSGRKTFAHLLSWISANLQNVFFSFSFNKIHSVHVWEPEVKAMIKYFIFGIFMFL